ncbi:YhbY family RNA-binding protein [Legionella geestiana]|uniref:YhbY family RNA-binding protein n=1 Tax=Legionella geestiana TaxID=45065 RepID=UPI0031453E1D
MKPVILLGAKGLTENVIQETRNALLTHELIKVKTRGMERDDRDACMQALCEAVEAQLIQQTGHIALIYRENPEKKAAAPSRKAPAAKRPKITARGRRAP